MEMPTWVIEAMEEKLKKIEAENARLREALETISGLYNDDDEPSRGYAGNIAREALKGAE